MPTTKPAPLSGYRTYATAWAPVVAGWAAYLFGADLTSMGVPPEQTLAALVAATWAAVVVTFLRKGVKSAAGALLLVVLLLPACASPEIAYVEADESTYKLLAGAQPPHYPDGRIQAWVARDLAEGRISQLEADLMADKLESWRVRIETAKKNRP